MRPWKRAEVPETLRRCLRCSSNGSLAGSAVSSIPSRDRLDHAEDEINTADAAKFRPTLASLRREIASVRRFLAPQRDALDRLNRQPVPFFDESVAHALRQGSRQHHATPRRSRLARERTVVLQEEMLSNIAQQQNARMYVLSVVAAISCR